MPKVNAHFDSRGQCHSGHNASITKTWPKSIQLRSPGDFSDNDDTHRGRCVISKTGTKGGKKYIFIKRSLRYGETFAARCQGTYS